MGLCRGFTLVVVADMFYVAQVALRQCNSAQFCCRPPSCAGSSVSWVHGQQHLQAHPQCPVLILWLEPEITCFPISLLDGVEETGSLPFRKGCLDSDSPGQEEDQIPPNPGYRRFRRIRSRDAMERSLHRVSLGSQRAHRDLSFYLTTFGRLKLSIDAQDRILLLHVIEAKGLMNKEPGVCDPYVKISLIPEDNRRRRQKTQTIPDCRNPAFHEHFFFPVHEEDEQKRLLVTVWNRAGGSRRSELIGCMSFGVKSLLTPDKEISGWYYLLGEDLGRTKHLKVARRRLRPLGDPLLRMPGRGDPENGEKLQITIPRGKDGFGFTICCDSPVRVQAVDSGGPAERAGLQQLDTVLQLNERPVEHWKCVELAHEIRSCPSEIILLVWRMVPQVKPGPDGGVLRRASCKSAHDLQSPPNKREKNCTHGAQARPEQRHSCHLVCDSSDGLLLGGWERYTEVTKRGGQHTLPALSRATAPTDPNYIILAPLNPGSQLLRPVYQEDTIPEEESGTPSKGKSSTGLGKKSRLMKTVQTMKGHGNYQNCPVLRPHAPHSSYGTYVTLAPKVLVFPVFVQPLDLCNPARTLLLSEELLLYEGRNKAAQVTLFAYSDLLLFTKEDEPGRCNVLRNPLYLQSVKLQEGSSEDLKFCVLYLAEKAECLFTLEAHSQEQKKRVCWCLAENIAKQQQLATSPLQSKKLHPYGSLQQEMGPSNSSNATQDRSFTSSGQTLIG
nr:regulator of G-protein signaling 3 isoform X6 [Oryctolagus cuniculus]